MFEKLTLGPLFASGLYDVGGGFPFPGLQHNNGIYILDSYKIRLNSSGPISTSFDKVDAVERFSIAKRHMLVVNPIALNGTNLTDYNLTVGGTAYSIESNITSNYPDSIIPLLGSEISGDISLSNIVTPSNVDLLVSGIYSSILWQPKFTYKVNSSFNLKTPTGYSEEFVIKAGSQEMSITEGTKSGLPIPVQALSPYSGLLKRSLSLRLTVEQKSDFYNLFQLIRAYSSHPMYINLGPNAQLDPVEQEYGRIFGYIKAKNLKEDINGYTVTLEVTDGRLPEIFVDTIGVT